ncbi:hypothetical protein [Flavobacterium sp. JP2137]
MEYFQLPIILMASGVLQNADLGEIVGKSSGLRVGVDAVVG